MNGNKNWALYKYECVFLKYIINIIIMNNSYRKCSKLELYFVGRKKINVKIVEKTFEN